MTVHTSPGPWKIGSPSRLYDDTTSIVAGNKVVAIVPADETMEVEDGAIVESLSPEAKANAALIAAAPELLATCQTLLALVALKYGNLDQDANKLQADARAVITKATSNTEKE